MQQISNEQFQKSFVDSNYELLAAIGWQGFMSSNRGLLMVSEVQSPANFPHWLIPTSLNYLMGVYIGEENYFYYHFFKSNWGQLSELVTSYEPDKVTLVAFHDPKTSKFSVYPIGTLEVSALGSFRKLQPRLVEFSFNL
jgi:hypothetical protein